MATALKPDKDFSKEVDQQIPQAELLAKVRLTSFVEKLEMMSRGINLGRYRTTCKVPLSSLLSSRSKRAR